MSALKALGIIRRAWPISASRAHRLCKSDSLDLSVGEVGALCRAFASKVDEFCLREFGPGAGFYSDERMIDLKWGIVDGAHVEAVWYEMAFQSVAAEIEHILAPASEQDRVDRETKERATIGATRQRGKRERKRQEQEARRRAQDAEARLEALETPVSPAEVKGWASGQRMKPVDFERLGALVERLSRFGGIESTSTYASVGTMSGINESGLKTHPDKAH